MIDDLLREASGRTSLTQDQTRQALAGALALLKKHGEPGPTAALFDGVPGAGALAGQGAAALPKGGLLGGLMKGVGGAGGAATADGMALIQQLAKDGISLDDLKALLPFAMQFIQSRTGQDLLGPVLKGLPGVGGMLGGAMK